MYMGYRYGRLRYAARFSVYRCVFLLCVLATAETNVGLLLTSEHGGPALSHKQCMAMRRICIK